MQHKTMTNMYHIPTYEECMTSGVVTTPVAFDLDSVLNTGDYLIKHVADAFNVKDVDSVRGMNKPYGYRTFHYEIPNISSQAIAEAVNVGVLRESGSALPSPFMRPVLDYIHTVTQAPILVVTARHPMALRTTHDWLEQNLDGIPFVCYMVPGHGHKLQYLVNHGVKIFIDDRHKTIMNLVGKIQYPVLFQQPWNQGRPVPLNVPEIRDLRDVIPLFNLVSNINMMTWPGEVPYPKPFGERRSKKYVSIC